MALRARCSAAFVNFRGTIDSFKASLAIARVRIHGIYTCAVNTWVRAAFVQFCRTLYAGETVITIARISIHFIRADTMTTVRVRRALVYVSGAVLASEAIVAYARV